MAKSALRASSIHDPAIARAKREWECIADALPQLLCLLNANGQVVRTNLIIERWSIRKVREALGLDLHSLLHEHCTQPACSLQQQLRAAWNALPTADCSEFETPDTVLGKTLKFEFRLMPDAAAGGDENPGNHAVCIISDITQLRLAEEGQRMLTQNLEARVQERTRELSKAVRGLRAEVSRREKAESSLRISRDELSLLSDQLMTAQESERKRIAQDLHDAVGQSLTAIKYSLERAVLMLLSPTLGNPLIVLNKSVEYVKNTIEEVRSISENLRPALLDGLGAVSAIRWLCREWSEVFTSVDVQINLHVTDADFEEPLGTTVFRTVQELLNNVAQHSKAKRIVLSICKEGNALRVDFSDNGVGFEPDDAAMRRGRGLSGVRERTSSVGGEFCVNSYPGGGTQVTLLWPIHAPASAGAISICAT